MKKTRHCIIPSIVSPDSWKLPHRLLTTPLRLGSALGRILMWFLDREFVLDDWILELRLVSELEMAMGEALEVGVEEYMEEVMPLTE